MSAKNKQFILLEILLGVRRFREKLSDKNRTRQCQMVLWAIGVRGP